jgi:hypothetical protein
LKEVQEDQGVQEVQKVQRLLVVPIGVGIGIVPPLSIAYIEIGSFSMGKIIKISLNSFIHIQS